MIRIANSDGSWMLLPPEQSRDREMLDLLNHEETMLPHLPSLCPMSWPDMQVIIKLPEKLRRYAPTKGNQEKTNRILYIIDIRDIMDLIDIMDHIDR